LATPGAESTTLLAAANSDRDGTDGLKIARRRT
jgi:hypothetical protein